MFISFEGIEGSGKSTALDGVCAALAKSGRDLLRTREPGGSNLGLALRTLLLDSRNSIAPLAELFLYLADRAQHVSEVIQPALASGKIVLSDRYADSTVVYQGHGRALDPERLHALNDQAVNGLWPDLTLIYDLDAATGLARARARNAERGSSVSEGRFEAEALAFHERVRRGYLERASRWPERFRIVNAAAAPEIVLDESLFHIQTFLDQGDME
jgi:dTMP kinase